MEKNIYHYHYPLLDSTNQHAKRWVDFWHQDGVTILTADEQTKGYGRHGRTWSSPAASNLYCTYIYGIAAEEPHLANSAQVVALAVASALEHVCGVSVQLKWPNDLLIDHHKVAGILIETKACTAGNRWLIIGLGLNVNASAPMLATVGQPATSLLLATGQIHCRQAILQAITQELLKQLPTLLKEGFKSLHSAYLARLVHRVGDTLHLKTAHDNHTAIFRSITPDGALQVQLANCQDTIHVFYSGDLTNRAQL